MRFLFLLFLVITLVLLPACEKGSSTGPDNETPDEVVDGYLTDDDVPDEGIDDPLIDDEMADAQDDHYVADGDVSEEDDDPIDEETDPTDEDILPADDLLSDADEPENDDAVDDASDESVDVAVDGDTVVPDEEPVPTVADPLTGLIWRKAHSAVKMNWPDAVSYCAQPAGGHTDWRLPEVWELETILLYDVMPTIDETLFDTTAEDGFWTNTATVKNGARKWTVYFDIGTSYHWGESEEWFVRCVRGSLYDAAPQFSEETVSDDLIVTDARTGYRWTTPFNGAQVNYTTAFNACAALSYGDLSDWELPTIYDIRTILDYTAYDPATDFPGASPYDYYWSATPRSALGQRYVLSLYEGTVDSDSDELSWGTGYYLCVKK